MQPFMQPIKMSRGTTVLISIVLYDESDQVVTLTSGEVLRFGVKRKPSDTDYIITKETATAEDNEYVFQLYPSDTSSLEYGRYYYDIGLQSGNNYYIVVECSYFDVGFNITKYESQ